MRFGTFAASVLATLLTTQAAVAMEEVVVDKGECLPQEAFKGILKAVEGARICDEDGFGEIYLIRISSAPMGTRWEHRSTSEDYNEYQYETIKMYQGDITYELTLEEFSEDKSGKRQAVYQGIITVGETKTE